MLFTIFGLGKKNSPYFSFHNVGRSESGAPLRGRGLEEVL